MKENGIANQFEIVPILFMPWDSMAFPETFQPLPQTSLQPLGGLQGLPGQNRADVQLRRADGNAFWVKVENRLSYLHADGLGKAKTVLPLRNHEGGQLVDFQPFGDQIYTLVKKDKAFFLCAFDQEGKESSLLELAQMDGVRSYQGIRSDGKNLYLLGNSSPVATFLVDPVLYRVEGDAVNKVHQWKGQSISDLYLNEQGNVRYIHPVDRMLYPAIFEMSSGKVNFTEAYDQRAYPYLKLPIGVDGKGRFWGREGLKVGAIAPETNALVAELAVQNLFLDADEIVYSSFLQDSMHVYKGSGSELPEIAVFPVNSPEVAALKVRNWSLVAIEGEGVMILQGFAPRSSIPYELRFDRAGNQLGEAKVVEKQSFHRMMPPAYWQTSANGAFIPSVGPRGLQIFELRF